MDKNLIIKYLQDRENLSEAEWEVLNQWLAGEDSESPERKELLRRLENEDWMKARLERAASFNEAGNWKKVMALVGAEEKQENDPSTISIRAARVRKLRPHYYAAAAVLLLIIAGGGYWQLSRKTAVSTNVAIHETARVIAAGQDRAILTLGDGRRLNLDSAGVGTLASQGNTNVVLNAKGQLAYTENALHEKPGVTEYNTLLTPRSGQFLVVLPDQTKVWVNNVSRLRYPTHFTGKERRVELSGEAYFEVAKDARRPFRVVLTPSGGGAEERTIEVLGTSFNAEAYEDEPVQRTTLVEGKVRVGAGSAHAVLNPGDQALIGPRQPLHVQPGVDVNQAIAWTKGYFNFDRTGFASAMRQLSRWYDVEVVYRKMPTLELEGKIQRNLSLPEVLKGLETEQVHFLLQGRTLIVE